IPKSVEVSATPVARKMAEEHGIELSRLKSNGGRIEKADVLAYLALTDPKGFKNPSGLKPASPKARRLASERTIDLSTLRGSGPNGAVLASDIPTSNIQLPISNLQSPISTMWRVMAERMTTSWTTAPHFFLKSDVNVSRFMAWREQAQKRVTEKITYTDLLVKVVAAALAKHPRLNVSWSDNSVVQHNEINVGVAVAVEDGLIVPVIHCADRLGLGEIAARRIDLVMRAQAGKLHLEDIQGGTFTISNLGMYGVDEFQAILNSPQAAILAVGRMAHRRAGRSKWRRPRCSTDDDALAVVRSSRSGWRARRAIHQHVE
ncbi:MAG: 2-oxo acid dehydrogenase subunit E2, partial [Chloroflexi bacterium]|nr:2-oxo acid dehydrogenase subunit E2 [Chloroflexota bacterium]